MMSKNKCVECNYMSFVEVTLSAEKYALCSDCGSMQEIGAYISGNLCQEVMVLHDISNESSKELKFGKDNPGKTYKMFMRCKIRVLLEVFVLYWNLIYIIQISAITQYFNNTELFHNSTAFTEIEQMFFKARYIEKLFQLYLQFVASGIANSYEIAKKNAERNDPAPINSNSQRSKDGCMYCDSTLFEVNDEATYCKKCFYYQEEPLLGYKPMLITSTGKVIVLDQNGPTEVKIPDHTCRYCCHTKLETILDDKVCLFCNKSQSVKNFFPMDQIEFELSPGKLVKLIDDRNSDDQKGLKMEITAMVKFEKSKSNIVE